VEHPPVAAGKSSIGHIDRELAFSHIISDNASTYLDLACGVGNYTLELARRLRPGCVIHALDLWEEGIAALQDAARSQGFTGVRALRADMTATLPLPDNSVDVCLMATVLHDLPPAGRRTALAEAARVLTPRGAVTLIEFKKLDRGPGPRIEQRIDEADAEALFAPHGFVKTASLSLGEFTYLARFARRA